MRLQRQREKPECFTPQHPTFHPCGAEPVKKQHGQICDPDFETGADLHAWRTERSMSLEDAEYFLGVPADDIRELEGRPWEKLPQHIIDVLQEQEAIRNRHW